MATYINSIFTPDQMGRLGAIVFSKGKYGYYMKTFTPPSNPQTEAQMDIRADFTEITRKWATLTDFQRSQWDAAAQNYTFSKGGKTYQLTGFNLYVKNNRNLQDVESAEISNVPADMSAPDGFAEFIADIDATTGNEDITLNFSPVIPAGVKLKVWATPVVKPGRKPEMKRLRMIGVIDSTFMTGDSIKDLYTAKYGIIPAAGQKAMFAVEPVKTSNGMVNAKQVSVAVGTI